MKIKLSKLPGNVVVELGRETPSASPFQLKRILVPLDFSTCSQKALHYAIPFAKQFRASIIFLHIIPIHFHFAGQEMEIKTVSGVNSDANLERQLTALIKKTVPPEIPVEIKIRHGVESAEIVNQAKESGTDIIILSTHGRTGRAHSLAGSVAEDVVRLAPCPVLVVRERQHEFVHLNSKTIAAAV